jgi:hypothetical protein
MHGVRSIYRGRAGSSSTRQNGIIGNRDLIRVAVARDPAQAVPLTGIYYGDADDELGMSVEVQVTTPQPQDWPSLRNRAALES